MADNEKMTATRVIDAPAKDVFAWLTLPRNHVALDGSGMVRAAQNGDQRISAVGDVFTMDMHNEKKGDYQRENRVTGYVENKLLAWKPGDVGQEPGGWEWGYELEAQGPDQTQVTLYQDWSGTVDPKIKQMLPVVQADALEASLANLASGVAGA